MGQTQSTPDQNDNGNNCQFLLNNVLKIFPKVGNKVGSNPNDPIGTPVPDTPLFQKKKRQEALQQATNNVSNATANGGTKTTDNIDAPAAPAANLIPPFNGSNNIYGGLEKEASTPKTLPPQDTTTGQVNNENECPTARVHEGPDCERHLHANYTLMEVLGVGSTSTVHRCMNRNNNEHYACKIIDKQHMEERFVGMLDQFQTEIEALKRLHHPNIIQLYDVYVTDEKIYIIMELMEGGELFDYVVQKGTLNEEEASRIVRKVTSALVYMHSKDIVHRDLKPENLLLRSKPRTTRDIEVKIIDFGLSKAMEEPVARSFLGTRGYIAPEMLQRRDYTRAVDTWALGVIVFVLLCGCLPFDDDSQTVPSDDLVRARFVLRFPRWANNLSASAKDLLSHLLDVNTRTRYSAEQALYHPWVQGTTAPRDNLLASPGRMKKSPILIKSPGGQQRPTNNYSAHRKYDGLMADQQQSSPASSLIPPSAQRARKNSF